MTSSCALRALAHRRCGSAQLRRGLVRLHESWRLMVDPRTSPETRHHQAERWRVVMDLARVDHRFRRSGPLRRWHRFGINRSPPSPRVPALWRRDFRPCAWTGTTLTLTLVDAGTATSGRSDVIFIEDFIDVSLPLGAIRGRCTLGGHWLTALASAAEEDGEVRLQVGPAWAGRLVTREVEVTVGPTRDRGTACVVPLAWKATGMAGLFPVLDGDLELAPLPSSRCRVTLSATYLPPFGDLGRALDRALLHRVAQSTVRSFLNRIAASLEAGNNNPAAQSRRGTQARSAAPIVERPARSDRT
jgi:hypothetical protein